MADSCPPARVDADGERGPVDELECGADSEIDDLVQPHAVEDAEWVHARIRLAERVGDMHFQSWSNVGKPTRSRVRMIDVVRLHDDSDVNLDFTLERGRVAVTNIKEKGPTKVRVRFHDQIWEATLTEPKTTVALELYGRWASGVPFTKKPGPKDVPHADLRLVAVEGVVTTISRIIRLWTRAS